MASKKKIRRRRFSDDFKKRVVAEANQSAASWSRVAREYDLNTNLLFRWKKKFEEEAVFLPIELDASSSAPTISSDSDEIADCIDPLEDSEPTDVSLEITLPCGTQLRCGQTTDPEVLSVALTVLRRVA